MKQLKLLMKFNLTVIALFLFTLSSWGQTQTEQEAVLEKCIDLSEIQEYLPEDTEGNLKGLHIMQHAVSFPDNMNVTKSGKEVEFMSKDQIYQQNPDAFFRFEKFDIEDKIAKVAFVIEYNRNSAENTGLVNVSLNLEEQDSEWIITETQFERR